MALDTGAFTAFERTAHDSIANRYVKVFTPLTSLALAPLLDAARVAMGQRGREGPRSSGWTCPRA